MTVILALLCLAIAGRELYLAFDRKNAAVSGPALAELERRLTLATEGLAELRRDRDADAADRAAAAAAADQAEQRLGFAERRLDALADEVLDLRVHLGRRLDVAVAASLGAPPPDTVAGAFAAADPAARAALTRAFDRFALRHGLAAELVLPATEPGGDGMWHVRSYLTGRSPRALEAEFIELLGALNGDPDDAVRDLLAALRDAGPGGAQLGPFVVARTAEDFVAGVLPLAELTRDGGGDPVADPKDAAARLHRLAPARYRDLPTSPPDSEDRAEVPATRPAADHDIDAHPLDPGTVDA
ncbi:hypothetical protein [Actinomadura atramentaria]|uniref:hypothetical protein n=1 Tax=Actinomadura atramentaria TaxID=1990 RepID=UPI0003820BAE|nr:hypothetical protein [Actinomadura atramentaria]